MKVLFVHDGPMMSNAAKTVFYGVHYTNEIVERYAYFGEKVTFLMRNKIVDDSTATKYTPLTHPAFCFVEVPNFKSIRTKFRQKEAKAIIEQAVAEHDIIIARLPSANGIIAKKIAEKLGKPVLVEVVACVFDALWNYDWRGKLLAHFKMYQYKKHIKSGTHVIYVTEKFLQERYPTEGKSIGCSDVVLQHFDESVLEKRLNKIKNPSEKTIFGTIAAIDVPYKGHAEVIKALYRLKLNGVSHFLYKIVGQGNPDRLNRLVKDLHLSSEVEILGSLPHDKVFDFIDTLDLYIQPSRVEGLPRAVIEAMSRGCPVLATDLGGHPELLDDKSLFKSGNPLSISNKLIEVKWMDQEKWALNNFEKSKNFMPIELQRKRLEFYKEFENDFGLK